MDEEQKEILMTSVMTDAFNDVRNIFSQYANCTLMQDDNFFDYELLKAACIRRHQAIITFLLDFGCRVRNPSKVNFKTTPLHQAIKIGNINIIKKIINNLKDGASIYDKNKKGDTPLCLAFKNNNYEVVDEILTAFYGSTGIKQLKDSLKRLKPLNKDDIQHFHIACIRDNLHVIKLYLKRGFDVNRRFSKDFSGLCNLNPVYHAFNTRSLDTFQCLLEHGADLSIIDNNKGQTLLHMIYYSDLNEEHHLSQVFSYGNDTKFINSVDSEGLSHLHLSCIINNPSIIQVFIDKGVDINSPISMNCSNSPGFTPLHFAVKYNCQDVVKFLLKNRADCNKADREGNTPLHLACTKKENVNTQIIQMLLDYNANAVAVNKEELTPLHMAFYNNYIKNNIIDMIISKIPRDVNIVDGKGLSIFHIVCTRSDVSRVNDLLKSGVDIDICPFSEKYSGFTPLHFAVLYQQKDVVELLLKRNAQVNLRINKWQDTCLHLACNFNRQLHEIADFDWVSNRENHFEIVKLLLLHGANIDAQDSVGKTPLLQICSIDRYHFEEYVYRLSKINFYKESNVRVKEIIQILLLNNANVIARSNNHESILHIICNNYFLENSEEILELFIINGADINAIDEDGLTPLHIAVKSKKIKLIEILLKYEADVNAKSEEGNIPLCMLFGNNFSANSLDDKNILTLLLENGSDINVTTENGLTLLHDAIHTHRIFTLQTLLNYGADINAQYIEGCPLIVSILTAWRYCDCRFVNGVNGHLKIFYIIFVHVQKLLAVGFYVHDKVKESCLELYSFFKIGLALLHGIEDVNHIFDNCLEELNRMKLIKVDNYNSLFNILQKDAHELSKYVRNSTLLKILNDQNIYDTFPLYSHLLKVQFKKGLERSKFLKFANTSLAFVVKENLPDICYDSILKYLTNEDITNLKVAVKSSYKRKLEDNSNDTELLTKLKKT